MNVALMMQYAPLKRRSTSTRLYGATFQKALIFISSVGGACGTHGIGQKSVQGFGGKAQRKRALVRPRRRWENGVRMDLGEIGLGGCGLDSTGSGQGPVAGCCECGDEPSGSCATELAG
jgi:hypothetical protein